MPKIEVISKVCGEMGFDCYKFMQVRYFRKTFLLEGEADDKIPLNIMLGLLIKCFEGVA